MNWTRAITVLALAVQGFLLLRPDGALVHAAQPNHADRVDQAAYWWRASSVHMGCSIASCKRPATRTASYRLWSARGAVWRVYGFCAAHTPPSEADALVYRVGRPRTLDYDLPLGPVWSPVYLLLGTLGFGIWCAGMWRYARPGMPNGRRIGFLLLHAVVIAGLFLAG